MLCVHKTEDGICPKCEEITKKREEEHSCYGVAGDWFEIKIDNLRACRLVGSRHQLVKLGIEGSKPFRPAYLQERGSIG